MLGPIATGAELVVGCGGAAISSGGGASTLARALQPTAGSAPVRPAGAATPGRTGGPVRDPPRCARLPWPKDWQLVLAIPDFPRSTAAARAALPGNIPLADAAFTAGRAALLVAAAHQGRTDWLSEALQDRLHQPYRRGLVRGYDEVEQAALAAGALGLTLSGAGPTLAAWTTPDRSLAVGAAMGDAWKALGVYAEIVTADIDDRGATPVG